MWWFKYTWPMGSGTIGCGVTGEGVTLLEEVCHCGGRYLRSHIYAQVWPMLPSPVLLLPVGQDVEFLAPPALSLFAYCCASHHDDNGLNL